MASRGKPRFRDRQELRGTRQRTEGVGWMEQELLEYGDVNVKSAPGSSLGRMSVG